MKSAHSLRSHNGHTPTLHPSVYVDSSSAVIGDVCIDEDSSIWPMCAVRGDMHSISIGKRTSIQDNSVLHITHASDFNPGGWPLTIGDDVTVGHRCVLHGCTIGNRILIGIGSIVMDGAIIEDEVIVGANSLVAPGKTLKSGWLYKGSPAKPARELKESERKFFKYTAGNYVKLKNQYLSEAEEPAG